MTFMVKFAGRLLHHFLRHYPRTGVRALRSRLGLKCAVTRLPRLWYWAADRRRSEGAGQKGR